jgi:hypothetical protein
MIGIESSLSPSRDGKGAPNRGFSRPKCRKFCRAPGPIKGPDKFNGIAERAWLFMKGVRAQFVSLFHSFGCRAAGENDDGQGTKFWMGTNVFEDFKAAGIGHDNIEDDQVGPANGMFAAHVQEALQVGNAPLGGFCDVPLKWYASFLAGGLKKDLIVGAVIDMKYKQVWPEHQRSGFVIRLQRVSFKSLCAHQFCLATEGEFSSGVKP